MKPRARYLALFLGHTRAAGVKPSPSAVPPRHAPSHQWFGLVLPATPSQQSNNNDSHADTSVDFISALDMFEMRPCHACRKLAKAGRIPASAGIFHIVARIRISASETKTVTDITTPTGRIRQRPRGMLGSGTRNHVCGLYLFHLTYEGLESELSTDV